MKSYTSFIAIAAVILIPLALFFAMCIPYNHSIAKAEDGRLDLRGESFAGRVHALNGDWRIAFGELLEPNSSMDLPGLISVPSTWAQQGYPRLGVATYNLTVYVDDERQAYMLMMNVVSSSYDLWVNGERIYSSGTVSKNAADSHGLYSNALLPVEARDGVLDIVLHVGNHEFYTGGLGSFVFFGNADSVQRYFIQTRMMYALALGCILMTAFYHLLLYLFRRCETAYALFSFLCFLCFVRFLFETDGINEYFQIVRDGATSLRLYMLLLALHSAAIIIFALYIFARDLVVRHKRLAVAAFILLGLVFWFMPINKAYSTALSTALILVFVIFAIVKAALSPVLRTNPWTRLYFVSLFVFLAAGFTKLFGSVYLYMPGLVSNLFMILSQSLLLSQSYASAFTLVEETNTNLEHIVNERTSSLQTANAAMLATNTAMKELMSNISHDLKTPLAIMSLNLETLSALAVTQNDAEYQRYVRTAYHKNLDLQRLILNLFEVSRIETGRNLCAPEWMPLLHLLAKAREKYDDFLEDKGISLDINVQDDIEIEADPQKIWSVFDNIIYNAARHTECGGSITITARNTDTSSTVIISDTGCGIAPEHLPHIFERFYKGSQSRGANDGDSGLGLYIVRSVMEGSGGSVTAKSVPGKGTSIILGFPAQQKNHAPA